MRLVSISMNIVQGYQLYLRKFDTPHNDFHLNLIRIFVGIFFAWKIMSRDFAFMGTLPRDFFYFYPYQIYSWDSIPYITGVPWLMELVTFHWIHWIVGFPSERVLATVQLGAALLMVALAVFGRGRRRVIAISAYIVATYLWGFIFLSGQEVDAVMLYFGSLGILCLANYNDVAIWRMGALLEKPPNVEAGRAFSAVILLFVLYYGLSGFNKLVDVNLVEWFNYPLVEDIEQTLRMQQLGNFYGAPFPSLFAHLRTEYWLNTILVPSVYLSHIFVFLIYFRRSLILKYAVFYSSFHFVTSSVSIAFTGYMIVWLLLIDWQRYILRLKQLLRPIPAIEGA